MPIHEEEYSRKKKIYLCAAFAAHILYTGKVFSDCFHLFLDKKTSQM